MRSRPAAVDLEQLERLGRDLDRHVPLVAHLGHVPHTPQNAVRDPGRPAGATRDLVGRLVRDLDAEDACGAPDDLGQLGRFVVPEPEGHAEAVAQRRRQQPGPGRRSDERERRQVERQGARRRPLAEDDVETEVLERRVERLLDGRVEAMDLVDEEHVALLESGQDRRDVALALERRAGDRPDAGAELLPDDVGEARLAEAGRPDEQDVVERLTARGGRLEGDRQLLLRSLLADELTEPPWPQ